MSMPGPPPKLPTCQSAYVYCGQGASTCSLDGGWEINLAAMDLSGDFRLACELRLGSGRCIEGSDFEVSPDAPVGTFEITEEMLHPAILSGLGLGIVNDIIMEVSGGGPVRRLASLEGHADELLGDANQLYQDHLDEVLGQAEHLYQDHQDAVLGQAEHLYQDHQDEVLGQAERIYIENQDELLEEADRLYEVHQDEVLVQAEHLYQDLVLKFDDYNIVFGGELSQEHVAFYATVCTCGGENCDWTNNPDTSSVSPSETIEPSATFVPLPDTASPSFSTSASLEPSASPSLSPVSSQLPTTAPTTASTPALTPTNNNGSITNNNGNTNVDKASVAAGSLNLGYILAIIAGCVAAVIVAALLVARRKKSSASESESSANSIGSDDNISP